MMEKYEGMCTLEGKQDKVGVQATLKECGDLVWYVQAAALELGFSFLELIKKGLVELLSYVLSVILNLKGSKMGFRDVMKMNYDKITSRKKRGTLKGDGDNR